MPVAGGTTRKLLNACWPQRRNWYRSIFRSNSFSTLNCSDRGVANWSTCTEWSITRSHGTSGLIFFGSPSIRTMALRSAARSTIAGTPVKSCRTTRPSLKGTSTCLGESRVPVRQIDHVRLVDDEVVDVPQARFQQHADRIGERLDVADAVFGQLWQAVNRVVSAAGLERRLCTKRILGSHVNHSCRITSVRLQSTGKVRWPHARSTSHSY